MLEKSELNVNGIFNKTKKVEETPKIASLFSSKQSPAGNDLDPTMQVINQMKEEMKRNEIKLGGRSEPGQLIRKGHFPKFSAMID